MPLILDYSKLTILERAALEESARASAPEATPPVTAEQFLETNVGAMIGASVEAYVHAHLPNLRELAVNYLNLTDERQEEVRALLTPAKESEPAPPSGMREHETASEV